MLIDHVKHRISGFEMLYRPQGPEIDVSFLGSQRTSCGEVRTRVVVTILSEEVRFAEREPFVLDACLHKPRRVGFIDETGLESCFGAGVVILLAIAGKYENACRVVLNETRHAPPIAVRIVAGGRHGVTRGRRSIGRVAGNRLYR